jgi:hypothetical protein
MNPTCRRLMRYQTPCPRSCRYCVTELRDPLGSLAEKVAIHPARDVDQTKGATADAVTGKRRQAGMDLLMPVRRPL